MSADPDHPVRYPGAGSHHRHRRTRIQTFVVPAASVTLTRSSRTRVPSRRAKSRVPSPRVYAAWLTGLGYTVHLVDPVPLHVEQAAARGASRRVWVTRDGSPNPTNPTTPSSCSARSITSSSVRTVCARSARRDASCAAVGLSSRPRSRATPACSTATCAGSSTSRISRPSSGRWCARGSTATPTAIRAFHHRVLPRGRRARVRGRGERPAPRPGPPG